MMHNELYDGGGEVGGPLVKNKVYVFGLYNPSVRRDLVRGAASSGLFALYGAQSGLVGRLRNAGLNLTDRLPVLKNILIRQAMS